MNAETVQPKDGLVEIIRGHLDIPQLWVCLREIGASSNDNHRLDIRRSLIEFLTQKLKERSLENVDNLSEAMTELLSISKLEQLPHTSFASISISHCPVVGGYALTPAPYSVGFDIELSERVRPALAERISSEDELMDAPSNASLWVAKEAAFKAMLGPQQPDVLSQIDTNEWTQLADNLYGFRFSFTNTDKHHSFSGKGCVATIDGLHMGFAVL